MREADLPPRPDAANGEPRPPRAPLEPEWKRSEDKDKNGESKVPNPPDGEGPTLEWFYPTRGRGGFFIVLTLIIFIGYFTLRDWGFGWMTNGWLWAIVAPFIIFFWFYNRNTRISAGADWLCWGNKSFVRTYELTKIKISVGGAARNLELTDRNGNTLFAPLHDLQLNRDLWDLVYNGVLHSVHVHGAETNKLARDFLGLNIPPQYRR